MAKQTEKEKEQEIELWSTLKSWAFEWNVYIAEDGAETCRKQYRSLIRKAKKFRALRGRFDLDHYPDGTEIATRK